MKQLLNIGVIVAGLAVLGLVGCASGPSGAGRPKAVEKYVQAMHVYHSGDQEAAMAQLLEATRVNPDLIMARLMLGDIYRGKGDYAEAVEQYEKVVRMDPYGASSYYRLGVGYQFMDRLKEAAENYQQALKLKPEDSQSNMNLGLVYLYMGQNDQALEFAQKATELDPDSASAWSNLGVTLDTMGEPAQAEKAYRQSIDLDPDNATTLLNLGSNLMAQNKFEEAVEVLRHAVRFDDNAVNRKRYGDALARSGRYDNAVRQYELALERDVNYWPAMNEIGFARIAEYRRGFMLDDKKREEAVAMWRRSLELNGNQPRVRSAVREWGAK